MIRFQILIQIEKDLFMPCPKTKEKSIADKKEKKSNKSDNKSTSTKADKSDE